MAAVASVTNQGAAQAAPALSPSRVSTFLECAARWSYKYIHRLPEPPTGKLTLGTAVHQALGMNFAQKIETEVDMPAADVIGQFRLAWQLAEGATAWSDDEDPRAIATTGEQLVETYMREQAPKIRPVAVEIIVSGEIAGIPVHGRVDVLDTDGRIIDWKTAAASPCGVLASHALQLATYARLTSGASGEVATHHLVTTKTPKIVAMTRKLTAQDHALPERLYPLAARAMRTGIYPPNRGSMLCSRRNCAFWRQCEADFGGRVEEV